MDCPVCGSGIDLLDRPVFDCPRCGPWHIPNQNNQGLRAYIDEALGGWERPEDVRRRSRASHMIRRRQRLSREFTAITLAELGSEQLSEPLPTPFEMIDQLVLWVGENQGLPNEYARTSEPALAAWLCCQIVPKRQESLLLWIAHQAEQLGLLENLPSGGGTHFQFQLFLTGWERFEQLRASTTESRVAFMAMQFGDPELDSVVANCFAPAVRRAGFRLRKVTDEQPAGLIDDQIRVALRTCRFVVADLTHRNLGAYWEAGFAEGLSRPVIYTCKRQVFDDPVTRPHFDTNHLLTILWESEGLADAGAKLTAAIRNTLPAEAKFDD